MITRSKEWSGDRKFYFLGDQNYCQFPWDQKFYLVIRSPDHLSFQEIETYKKFWSPEKNCKPQVWSGDRKSK